MKYICTLVVVNDIEKSKVFYRDILGQKIIADFGENVSFEGGFAIHQKTHFSGLINQKSIKQKTHNFELYFEDNDLETLIDKLKKNNVEFIHEIKEQPWKQRVMRFYDYDYNVIEIGESMDYVAYRLSKQGNTIDEICNITYLSKDTVEDSIKLYSKS